MTTNYIYGAIDLVGGLEGALDAINGDDLFENDNAVVFTDTNVYFYRLDETSGATENSPAIIAPDTNPGTKRWELLAIAPSMVELDTSTFSGLLSGTEDDVQKALEVLDDIFATDDFDISSGVASLKDAVVKSIATDSGSITPVGHQFSVSGTRRLNTSASGTVLNINLEDLNITTKTTTYTITADDDIVIGDTAGGSYTLTLPAANAKDCIRVIKKSNSNVLTIERAGSDTIEGNTQVQLNDEYEALVFISDGNNTWIEGNITLPTATSTILGGVKIGTTMQQTNQVLDVNYTAFPQDLVPDQDNVRSLGSATKAWKDVYVGPGSFYVNGQQVVTDDSGTIVLSADDDQNLQIKTGGGGDIEFYPSGSGAIEMKGSLSVQAGKNLLSNDGNPISCTVGFNLNAEKIINLATPTDNTDAATKEYVDGFAGNASNITTGTLPTNVLPPLSISTIQTAGSEAAMLALSTQQGDTVIRTDENKTYVHNGGSAGDMTDFTEIITPAAPVTSVNGDTGTVVLTQDDIAGGSTYVQTENNLTDALLTKLNNIDTGATDDQTPTEILTAIKTVDGDGSGLDADTVDGLDAASFLRSDADDQTTGTLTVDKLIVSSNDQASETDILLTGDSNIATTESMNFYIDSDNNSTTSRFYWRTNSANGGGTILMSLDESGVLDVEATSARYADLAEKHTCCDEDLATGTVVSACSDGEFEVQACMTEKADNVIGVVSSAAAHIMNADLTNSVTVGLVGKVPVRIIGPVEKGKPIVSAGNGCARQAQSELELLYKIGVSLVSDSDTDERLVLCAIK